MSRGAAASARGIQKQKFQEPAERAMEPTRIRNPKYQSPSPDIAVARFAGSINEVAPIPGLTPGLPFAAAARLVD